MSTHKTNILIRHSWSYFYDPSLFQHLNVNQIQVVVRRCSSPNVTEETTYFIPRNAVVDAGTNTDPPVVCCPLLRRFCPCPPRGLLASLITKGTIKKKCNSRIAVDTRIMSWNTVMDAWFTFPRCLPLNTLQWWIYHPLLFQCIEVSLPLLLPCNNPKSLSTAALLAAVLFGAVWSITEKECLPGGNLFGVTSLFICALIGGKLVALIRLPGLPPFPPLLGKALDLRSRAAVFLPPKFCNTFFFFFDWCNNYKSVTYL